jgi:16S rRNA (guanine966-N2)-methyltransferase
MRLRIISGEFKGRFISVPQSDLIRPTTDRVRETLFNILNNKIDFKDIEVLDLYSGSGSLGLECLSRGAHHTDFVEKNFQIRKKLEENILSLNLKAETTVYQEKALTFCDNFRGKKYDLILADPPFFKDDIYEVVKNLLKNNFLAENGFIIIERSIQTKEKDVSNFKVEPFKVIGDACLYEITNN